ncbi:MAG: sugar transferase, partial [Calditrichia bacterium]
ILGPTVYRPIAEYFSTPVFLLLSLVWIFLFFLNDLYRLEWDVSRFDKIMRVTKVITFGIIVISILTTDFQRSLSGSQIFSLLLYWFSLVILINSGRLIIIEIEKRLKIFEYSPKKTLIIGCNDFGKGILQDIRNNPHLIFDVVGFVSRKSKEREFEGKPVLGNYSDLPALIHQHKIEEILITLPESATEDFMKILSLCEAQQVKIKMPPGSHEVFVGQQHKLVSHAYLQIFSESMVLWQWVIKRLFDIFASLAALIILSPFYLITAVYIGLKFRKSVFFKIPILGKNAIPFGMYVFRITHAPYDYDKNMLYVGTGPSPERLKGYLNFLYKSRFYKLPQLFNVLLGDMSLIGPRPEPLEWYSQYQSSLRFLHRRLTVRPGITGLAQVKYHYELSQKILQERVKFDIFYIENMALRMDLRVLIRTLLLIFKKPPSASANGVPVMKK